MTDQGRDMLWNAIQVLAIVYYRSGMLWSLAVVRAADEIVGRRQS